MTSSVIFILKIQKNESIYFSWNFKVFSTAFWSFRENGEIPIYDSVYL